MHTILAFPVMEHTENRNLIVDSGFGFDLEYLLCFF